MIIRVVNPESGSGIPKRESRRFPTVTSGSGFFRDPDPDLLNESGVGPDLKSRRDPDGISGLIYFACFSRKYDEILYRTKTIVDKLLQISNNIADFNF